MNSVLLFRKSLLILFIGLCSNVYISASQQSGNLQNSVLPFLSNIVQAMNSQQQAQKIDDNRKENLPKKEVIHFISSDNILPKNYFIQGRSFYIDLDILKSSEESQVNACSNISCMNEIFNLASKLKENGTIDKIVVNASMPFYTYNEYRQPGLFNIINKDILYKAEIEKIDPIYVEYLGKITNLILDSSVDVIVYKNEDVKYEHNVIQASDNHMLHVFMVESEDDFLSFSEELNVGTRDLTELTVYPYTFRINLFHYFPPTTDYETVTIETSAVAADLTLNNALNVAINDTIDIKTEGIDSISAKLVYPITGDLVKLQVQGVM